MKESNFYSDDFEQLIRGKTEQYKMYPSENVWKGVHNSLHTKRKWFIGSMAFLVTGILYFSGKELIAPSVHPVTAHRTTGAAGAGTDLTATDAAAMDPAKTNSAEDSPHSSFASLRPNSTTATSIRRVGSSWASSGLSITISNLVISQPDIAQLLSHLAVGGQAPALIAATGTTANAATGKTTDNDEAEPGLLDSWLVKNNADNAAVRKPADVVAAGRSNTETGANGGMNGLKEATDVTASKESAGDGADAGGDDAAVRGVLESLSYKNQQRISGNNHLAHTKSGNTGMLESDVLPDSAGSSSARASTAVIGENADRQRLNWLHDYAVYTLPPTPGKGRILLQFTLTPTVNYRSLSGGSYPIPKNAEGAPLPSSHPEGVQNWVNLSPGFGFEFGSNVIYRVTRNLSIKGGLQFGFTRYQMPAYASKTQQSNTLETYYGYYTDSLNSMATSGNYPGKTTQTITNNFYQLAVPLGFELRILGNEQLQFNIAATIQPSYLLNTDSYMLSSDYSLYNKQPSVYRRWNLSGEVEAFLSYQTGPLRWQIGPEFRYQMLSTYNATYPINENVKGYGLKIGITKALP
jgi:Outer membrane protein beta-barrel domain